MRAAKQKVVLQNKSNKMQRRRNRGRWLVVSTAKVNYVVELAKVSCFDIYSNLTGNWMEKSLWLDWGHQQIQFNFPSLSISYMIQTRLVHRVIVFRSELWESSVILVFVSFGMRCFFSFSIVF